MRDWLTTIHTMSGCSTTELHQHKQWLTDGNERMFYHRATSRYTNTNSDSLMGMSGCSTTELHLATPTQTVTHWWGWVDVLPQSYISLHQNKQWLTDGDEWMFYHRATSRYTNTNSDSLMGMSGCSTTELHLATPTQTVTHWWGSTWNHLHFKWLLSPHEYSTAFDGIIENGLFCNTSKHNLWTLKNEDCLFI